MPSTPAETVQAAAEEEVKKRPGTDPSPLSDAVTATVDGALSVVEGVGDLAQGAVELVGGLLGGLAEL